MSAMLERVREPGTYQAFQHSITDAPWSADAVCATARLDPGLRISWVPVAVCPDASTRATRRLRRNRSDTVHVVLGGMTVLHHVSAIGFGARAFGKQFRLYSIASIVVLLAFGALTFLDAPRLQANLPTPWIGLWERINISVFLLWVVMLCAVLWRTGTPEEATAHVLPISVRNS